jgi:hypothetical protein
VTGYDAEGRMRSVEMIGPSIGRELVRAKVEGLRAEAVRDGRTRRPRRAGGLRFVLGVRLVSAGNRLLRQAVEVR